MAEDIIEKTEELRRLIIESDEYEKYRLYKDELDLMPELKEKLQQFRQKNFEIQLEGKTDNKEYLVRFVNESKDILENQHTLAYLNAELALCKKLQQIYRVLSEGIDLDLDFL